MSQYSHPIYRNKNDSLEWRRQTTWWKLSALYDSNFSFSARKKKRSVKKKVTLDWFIWLYKKHTTKHYVSLLFLFVHLFPFRIFSSSLFSTDSYTKTSIDFLWKEWTIHQDMQDPLFVVHIHISESTFLWSI